MIIDGCPAMIFQLKELWRLCFEDCEEDIDYFFRYRFDSTECMVDWQEGRVTAMLFLLSAQQKGILDKSAGYIYAFATHPDFRGRGIATKLLKSARLRMIARGGFTFLCPAEDPLYYFYAKRGFRECYSVWTCGGKASKTAVDSTRIHLTDCSALDYYKQRSEYLKAPDIFWDAAAVKYAVAENNHSGGICKKIYLSNNSVGAVLCRMDKDKVLWMRELLLPQEYGYLIPELAVVLAEQFKQENKAGKQLCWRVLSPVRYKGAARQRIGMADTADGEGYLNLILD